jgi:hypothetical protein
MLAAAFGVPHVKVYDAIRDGHLEVRTLPGTVARRILVADAERWYREHWLNKVKSTKKKVPLHG